MKGINKAILIGHLGQDPEVRYTADGKPVTNISVATSEKWKDKQGAPQEETQWHRVVFFGKLAEIAGEYLSKGSLVYIEGKIKTRKWQDKKTNTDRYTTEIVCDGFNGQLQMLGGKGDNQKRPATKPAQSQFRDPPAKKDPDNSDWEDDDIPF